MNQRIQGAGWRGCAAAVLLGSCLPVHAMDVATLPEDLTELSLEDLMAVEVVSVSKRAEPLQEAAGAVFVISGEEIRRSGARSIAEALRRVPGLHVAAADTSSYAISARGFNSTTADKMEVLIDGRSVYTPLFSGVFWDALDTHMADIERIEVIRGPGATLWGANAVNGVINIVTRKASAADGTLLSLSGGNELRAQGALRTTARIGDGAMRIYAKAFELDDAVHADGSRANDGQRQAQAGFRLDLGDPTDLAVTLSGDVYDGRLHDDDALSGARIQTDTSGANLNARLSWGLGDMGSLDLRTYLDTSYRRVPGLFEEKRDTVNADLQHRFGLGDHELIYGFGARLSRDETGGPPLLIVFSPPDRTVKIFNAFVQDKISFAGGRVKWTIGSKFEHNDFTGFEVQPGTRLGWVVDERWFTWSALSRAVRTPNRLDHNIAIFCPPPDGLPPFCGPGVFPIGSPGFESETLTALEWGLRYTDHATWSADLALFLNRYDKLRTTEATPPFGAFANRAEAQSLGGEISLTWRPAEQVELRGSYSYLGLDISTDPGSTDPDGDAREDTDPRHQATLRLNWQPAPVVNLDAFVRHVSRLETTEVPAYTELNLRLGWRAHPTLELALIGDNLLDAQHPEFGQAGPDRVELQRSVRLQLQWNPE